MELTDSLKALFVEGAKALKGSARRLFLARTVQELGKGGQRRAQRELGWCRDSIRKGTHELRCGITCCDAFSQRGRKPAQVHLPNLLQDLKQIVDGQSQTDPSFKSTRLYTRLSAAAVRQALVTHKGYRDDELPSQETIRVKLNDLGYMLRSVKKSVPQKN